MNSLLPIGLPAANPALPALPALKSLSPAVDPTADVNGAEPVVHSFLAFFKQSSTTLAHTQDAEPLDLPAQTTPADRAMKINKGWNALLANAPNAPVAPAENQPFPVKLSLNIFRTHVESANVPLPESNQPEKATPAATEAKESAPATILFPATTIPAPAPAPAPVPAPSASSSSVQIALMNIATNLVASAPTPAVASAISADPPAPLSSPSSSTASKTDRPRSLKSTAVPAEDPTPVQVMPAAIPQLIAPPAPLATPAIPTPASASNSESASSPSAAPTAAPTPAAPRPEQNHARLNIDTEVPQKAALTELAFALRLQSPTQSNSPATPVAQNETPVAQNETPVAALPAKTAEPQQAPAAAVEIKQTAVLDQPSSLPNKPAAPEAGGINVPQPQSQAGQNDNADSNSGAASDDTNRDNRHFASALKPEPVAAPNAGPAEISQSSAQGIYTPSPSTAASSTTPTPVQSTQQTHSTSLNPAIDETTKTGTANRISISVPTGDQQKVEVRLMDRAGEVRVSVHAPNEELAGTLRQDLGALTGKLNQNGFSTEAFTPSRGSADFSRDQKNAEPQQQSGSERQSSGRGQQQQSSPQNGRNHRPAWLDELENTLAT